MPELTRVVRNLLHVTASPMGQVADIARHASFASLGLLWRAHGLVEAILILHQAGTEDVGVDVLAKSVFEHAATGLWLLEELDTAPRRLVQDGNHRLRLLAEGDTRLEPDLAEAHRRLTDSSWSEYPFEERMPNLKDRLVGPLKTDQRFYTWYRWLSSRVHPSLSSVDQLLERTPEGRIIITNAPEDTYTDRRLGLPFAALMYWSLAERLHMMS